MKKILTILTEEQSARLIGLGVPKEKASYEQYVESNETRSGIELPPKKVPIFGLVDLLQILPKEIRRYGEVYSIIIQTGGDLGGWNVNYWFLSDSIADIKCSDELINALYEVLVWLEKNRIIGFTKPFDPGKNKTNG